MRVKLGDRRYKSEAVLLWEVEMLRERLNRVAESGVDHRSISMVQGISSKLDLLITEYMKSQLASKGSK